MDTHAIRNFRDFLLQYNRISENCFSNCVDDLTSRELTQDEAICAEKCTYKHVKLNNRAMQVYVEVQPSMTQKRIDEMNKQAEQQKLKLEAEQQKVVAEAEPSVAARVDNTAATTENLNDT